MATITDYFEQAQLSMAAYAINLKPGILDARKLEVAGMSKRSQDAAQRNPGSTEN